MKTYHKFRGRLLRMLRRSLSGERYQQFGRYSIRALALAFGQDLLTLAHHEIGIMRFQDWHVSGEQYVLSQVVARLVRATEHRKPVLMDVGANIGDYTCLMAGMFPGATVYSFEPNPHAYQMLCQSVGTYRNVIAVNQGLGAETTESVLYITNAHPDTSHGSLYQPVLSSLHHYSDVEAVKVSLSTLDEFCVSNRIQQVDFLKIDTEGHELAVLQGADGLIQRRKLFCIQFEFNEMNVITRVFLRDFFEMLDGYTLYRLLPDRLVRLKYSSRQEIFAYQNILAVSNELTMQIA